MFCMVVTGRMNDGDERGDVRRKEWTRRSGECGKRILLIVVNMTATFKMRAKKFRLWTTNTPYLKVVQLVIPRGKAEREGVASV